MSDRSPQPDRVEELLTRLAAITPDAQSTQSVLSRLAAKLPPAPKKRHAWRWIVPTSIAAALVITALILLAIPAQSVSAQEMLATTLAANEQYKGWVHMTLDKDGKSILHWNTQNGSYASRMDYDPPPGAATFQVPQVRYGDADARTAYSYLKSQNTIRVSALDPEHSVRPSADTPLNFPALLQRLREVAGEDAVKITQSQDRGMDRFDLTITEPAQRALPKEFDRGVGSLGRPSVVWVDPKTKLISVVKTDDHEITFTYGPPEIHSIYDMGVPRDAKIIDNRPTPDALAAVKRVQARMHQHFPDGLVIKLQTAQNYSGLTLYFRRGAQWTMREYSISGPSAFQDNALQLPEHWDTTGHQALLRQLAAVYPAREIIGDGIKASEAEYKPDTGELFLSYGIGTMGSDGKISMQSGEGKGRHEMSGSQAKIIEEMFSPTRDLYPEEIGQAYASDNHLDLITSPDRPEQIGFRVRFPGSTEGSLRFMSQEWVDPAHDDRAVSFQHLNFVSPTVRQVESRTIREFSEYQQLPAPDGRWIPTQWIETTYDASNQPTQVTSAELHFYPGEPLPPIPPQRPKP